MANAMHLMPELQGEELVYIQTIFNNISDDKAGNFVHIYRSRRRKPQETLILALIGLLGIAGIHRFLLNQIAMGILYLLTIGVCYIGTIIDAINYQRLTFEYNRKIADEVFRMI